MGRRPKKKDPKFIRGIYTDAQNKLTQRYIKDNYDEIKVRVYKGERSYYAEYAKKMKTSMNRFCIDAMNFYIEYINEVDKRQKKNKDFD